MSWHIDAYSGSPLRFTLTSPCVSRGHARAQPSATTAHILLAEIHTYGLRFKTLALPPSGASSVEMFGSGGKGESAYRG